MNPKQIKDLVLEMTELERERVSLLNKELEKDYARYQLYNAITDAYKELDHNEVDEIIRKTIAEVKK